MIILTLLRKSTHLMISIIAYMMMDDDINKRIQRVVCTVEPV